jgi:hypothetical protein
MARILNVSIMKSLIVDHIRKQVVSLLVRLKTIKRTTSIAWKIEMIIRSRKELEVDG